MPKNPDFKRLVRERMKESGERYTEARQSLQESPRLVVAIDTPGLGWASDFQAKTLANKLFEAGFTARYQGPQRYRTAGEVVGEIRRISPDTAVLVVEAEGAELLLDEIIDLLDEGESHVLPMAILSSRSKFNAYDVLGKGRGMPGKDLSVFVGHSGLATRRLSNDRVPAFVNIPVLLEWLREVAHHPAHGREMYLRLAIEPQVIAFLNSVAKTLFIDTDVRPQEIVRSVEVIHGPPVAVTVETQKPGLVIGRRGETSEWLRKSLVEITGDVDVQFHLREVGTA